MPNLLSRRVAFVDIESQELATGDSEGGESVEAQGAANQQLYELAIKQHASSPAEAARSYEQLLAQPIVVAAVAEPRAAKSGDLHPTLLLKLIFLTSS